MRRLIGLDEKMTPVVSDDHPEAFKDVPTLRDLLRLLANTKAKTADDARRFTRLILKLRGKEPAIDLDDGEFKILKELVEANPVNYTAFMQGQILIILDNMKE